MKNFHGFCLLELACTITLFIFIALLVVSHGSYLQQTVVKYEIEKLLLLCRHLQQQALLTNMAKELTFIPSTNSYTYDSTIEKLSKQVEFGCKAGVLGPPSDPAHQISSPVTFAHNKIIFHADGIIQPGTVYLISKDRTSMYALSCAVSQVSYLRIYRYDTQWHCIS